MAKANSVKVVKGGGAPSLLFGNDWRLSLLPKRCPWFWRGCNRYTKSLGLAGFSGLSPSGLIAVLFS